MAPVIVPGRRSRFPAATVTRFATRSERVGYPAGVTRGAPFSSSIAIAVALTLPASASARVLEPPSGATAAAPSEPAATGEEKPVDMDAVKRIYAEGKAKYDTHDYKGAIDKWTEALALLPPVTENREIRNDLVYNIATAQEKAYDIDKDLAHLRSARALLVDFVDEYKRLYTPTDEARAEVERVKDRIAKLDERIAAAEKNVPKVNPYGTDNAEAKRKAQALQEVFASDPELARQYKSGRGMIIGGSVMLGLGALSLLVAAASIPAASHSGPDRGINRGIAFAFGAVGIGGVVAGAVLLGIGVPKRKRALETAKSRVVIAPTLGPAGALAGFGLVGRF
jgi:chorismate mutase